jgi:hypothetical protein
VDCARVREHVDRLAAGNAGNAGNGDGGGGRRVPVSVKPAAGRAAGV